jgi:hypothetical protein
VQTDDRDRWPSAAHRDHRALHRRMTARSTRALRRRLRRRR